MGARRGWPRRLAPVLVLWALLPLWLNAGEPGRLEEDAEFLLGSWASDCGIPGAARIFLSDGALRQEGLLRLVARDGSMVSPVTLLAATRDGVGLSLESGTRINGTSASSSYLARVISERELAVKSMTICRGQQCQTTVLELTWKRCTTDG